MFYTSHDDCNQSFYIQRQQCRWLSYHYRHDTVNTLPKTYQQVPTITNFANDDDETSPRRKDVYVRSQYRFVIYDKIRLYRNMIYAVVVIISLLLFRPSTTIAFRLVRIGRPYQQLPHQSVAFVVLDRSHDGQSMQLHQRKWYQQRVTLHRRILYRNRPYFDGMRLQFYLQDDQYNNETGSYLNTPLERQNSTTTTTCFSNERNLNSSTITNFSYRNRSNDTPPETTADDEIDEATTKYGIGIDETNGTSDARSSETATISEPQFLTGNNNFSSISSRNRQKASLASLGDIMDGLSTPSVPPSTEVDSQAPGTSVPLTLEQKYGISNPLDRMVVTANGNLQRLVSSYYDSPVSVVVDSCSIRQQLGSGGEIIVDSTTAGRVWDRTVRLIVHDTVFCTAKSIITVYDPYCQQLVESNQIGIGQLFRYLDILPEFMLHDAGYNSNVSDDDGGALWRVYTLKCKELSCYIREDFIPTLWNMHVEE